MSISSYIHRELIRNNTQIYTEKYMVYFLTEEELKRELNLDDFEQLDK